MNRPTRYQELVANAKQQIAELSPKEASELAQSGGAVLIDVREESEWREGHAAGAQHLSRGMLEVEIEERVPNLEQAIICYCGAGGRSALAAASLQTMGYTNVKSMAGGVRAWKEASLPMASD